MSDASDEEPPQESGASDLEKAVIGAACGSETGNNFRHFTVDDPQHNQFRKQVPIAVLNDKSGAFIPIHREPPHFAGSLVDDAVVSRLRYRFVDAPTACGSGCINP